MTDYTELVKALRTARTVSIAWEGLMNDAAAAIEALQADVEFYKNLSEEKFGMYRAQNIYSAKDSSGHLITNVCSLNRSEIQNS